MGPFSLGRIAACISLCAALVAWSAAAWAASAGAFQFVAGDVRLVLAAGSERPARKGTLLSVGDTVVTARGGTAQIKMGDSAIVVVQPESRLTVVEFRYEGVEDGSEKVVYRLEQGGFRAITGAIGRRNKDTYQILTPIAQMGVRGTDHESYYLPVASAGGAPAGVYNKVNVGAVYIRTRGGEVVVGPSQAGYAASASDAPRLLANIPGFFNGTNQPRPAFVLPARERTVAVPVEQPVMTTSGVNLTDPSASAPGAVAAATTSAPPAMGSGSVVAYNEGNGGVSRSGLDLAIAPNGATVTNAGGEAAFGVDWGTWQGAKLTVEGKPTDGGAHFISSTQLTTAAQLKALPPALVSATYNYVGGPPPTNQAGAAGSINSLSVGVNFSTQAITNYTVNASAGGATWNASGSGTFSQFSGSSGIALKGTCSGCSTSTAANGSASGALVGSAAERMITSFGVKAGPDAISGAALLSR